MYRFIFSVVESLRLLRLMDALAVSNRSVRLGIGAFNRSVKLNRVAGINYFFLIKSSAELLTRVNIAANARRRKRLTHIDRSSSTPTEQMNERELSRNKPLYPLVKSSTTTSRLSYSNLCISCRQMVAQSSTDRKSGPISLQQLLRSKSASTGCESGSNHCDKKAAPTLRMVVGTYMR